MFKTDYMSILQTQSKTGETTVMMEEINRQLDLIKGLTKETDDYGNLYVTKGKSDTYPAFVCHTDTVHKIYKTFTVVETELNYIFAYSEDEGFKQVGVGGDDKSGIIACLELLTKLKTVKCVFFLDEEQGCKGSAVGKLEFFDDCRYAIQIDRKGGGDIITKGSGTQLCSPEFETFIETLGKTYVYKPTTGATTDVVKLKDRGLKISACNLSAGYYNPHTQQEYIDVDELLNCIDFCVAISRIKTVYPHVLAPKSAPAPYKASPYTSYSKARRCELCSETLGYHYGIICNNCITQHLTLTVNENNEGTVVQTSYGDCEGCGYGLYSVEEVAVKYCESCQFCKDCGMSLDTKEEFRMGACIKCLWDASESAEADGHELCRTKTCINILSTQSERLCGYCSECVKWERVVSCLIVGCGSGLRTEEEQDTGVCNTCRAAYH